LFSSFFDNFDLVFFFEVDNCVDISYLACNTVGVLALITFFEEITGDYEDI
jgi:hypothetical protein